MPSRLALLLCLAVPVAGLCETPLDAAAFDARTLGRTITYSAQGKIYGIEQYLPNRQVRWSFVGRDCKDGHWYEQGPYICFVYEPDVGPQCWIFLETEAGLSARFRGDTQGAPLVSLHESAVPMHCAGTPHLGV
jgi:hypothetical protein